MSDKIYKSGNIKNREFLADKNRLPLADKVDEKTLAKTIQEKNELIKDSVEEAINGQGKDGTARIQIKGENTTEYFKNNPLPKPESISKPEVQISKTSQFISKVDNIVEKVVPYLDDTAKVIGGIAKVSTPITAVVGFFNPESTATDKEMGVHLLNKGIPHPPEKEVEKTETSPRLENIQNIENLSATEKENMLSVFKDWAETEQPSYLQDMEKSTEIGNSDLTFETDEISMEFSDDGDSGSDGGGEGGE